MKKFLCAVVLSLCLVGTAFAVDHSVTVNWMPDADNTMQADAFPVMRQVNGGQFVEVCKAMPGSMSCMDMNVPSGNVCWKAVAMSGTVVGPESAPVCKTIHKFTGSITVIVNP